MNDKIEEYYNEYNFPSGDRLNKLLKNDGYEVKKNDIETFLSKQEEAKIFKETKKVRKNKVILYLNNLMLCGN